ncbi:MAG: sigma-70 family RNA polymerase sigma factor [Rhodomicrobium sp.]
MSAFKTGSPILDQGELADLLRRTAEGDRQAFSALYNKTGAKLFGLLRRICSSEETAREALQECYVLIWKNAASYKPALAAPMTWMARIARNKAIDVRRLQSERVASASAQLDFEAPSLDADPLAVTEKNDELRRLADCLRGLPADRREMILLAYYTGLSREELGARFARPVNTVKTLLRRGLAQLKECLDGHD